MICSSCQAKQESKNNRPPRGWKRREVETYCSKCWKKRFVLRAVTIPVVGPVDGTWDELRAALGTAWSQTTALSNWLFTELYANDARREPGMSKLPQMPKTYLYPEARKRFPELPTYTVATLAQAASGKYRSMRYKVIWTGENSLPNYRYPVPFPVRRDGWKPRFDEANTPFVDLRIGPRRWTLRLRSGRNFRRQISAFRQMVDGEAERSELALYRQRASSGDHRSGVTDRAPGGGQRQHFRVMCKLVAWLPREEPRGNASGILNVSTDKDCFWQASVEGRNAQWTLNADHVRRWQHAHQRRRKRLLTDMKDEQRRSTRARLGLSEQMAATAEKYRRRIDSFCHEACAQLVRFAVRQRVGKVKYSDVERSYVPQFPWYRLRKLLEEKLDEQGIELLE